MSVMGSVIWCFVLAYVFVFDRGWLIQTVVVLALLFSVWPMPPRGPARP